MLYKLENIRMENLAEYILDIFSVSSYNNPLIREVCCDARIKNDLFIDINFDFVLNRLIASRVSKDLINSFALRNNNNNN